MDLDGSSYHSENIMSSKNFFKKITSIQKEYLTWRGICKTDFKTHWIYFRKPFHLQNMINIKLIKPFKGCLKSGSTQYNKTPLSWYIKYFSQIWKWGDPLNKFVCDVKAFYKKHKNSIREEPTT